MTLMKKNGRFYKLVEVDRSEIKDGEAFVFAWDSYQLDACKVNGEKWIHPDWVLNVVNGSVGVFRMETLISNSGR